MTRTDVEELINYLEEWSAAMGDDPSLPYVESIGNKVRWQVATLHANLNDLLERGETFS